MKVVAAELREGNKPSLNEALGWIGSGVDDIYGASVGLVEDVWIDPGTGAPRWLLIKEVPLGGRSTLIPFDDATAGLDHLWIPYDRDVVWAAPQIEPGVPLTRQVEATLSNHYATSATAAVSHRSQPAAQPDSRATSATVRLASMQPEAPSPGRAEPSPIPPPRLPQRPPPPVAAPPPGFAPEQPPPPPAQFPPPPQPEEPRYEYPRQPQSAADSPQQHPHPYQPVYQPPPPPPAGYQYQQPPAQQPSPPVAPDPSAMLAAIPPGSHVEFELAGNLTISGELRQVRITPGDGRPPQRT